MVGRVSENRIQAHPTRYSEGTITSEDAAAQVGCDVSQIAKSIVFEGKGAE